MMWGIMRQSSNTVSFHCSGRPSAAGGSWREALFQARVLRGGRMTKWKGEAASCAAHVADPLSCALRAAGARLMPAVLLAGLAAGSAAAADFYWDPNGGNPGQGGTGTWNTGDAFWNQ